jgi:uncharacterized membrane protein (Fun14 family)
MKIAAVVVGLFVAGLVYLSYRGWVDVKWVAMEDASRSTLTNASEQVSQSSLYYVLLLAYAIIPVRIHCSYSTCEFH